MKKKILLFAAIIGASMGSIAQEDNSDKVFTPEAGDWALGFDANPILFYVGNMFNGYNAGNSLNTNFVPGSPQVTTSGNSIYGKYFVDETTAFRGLLRINKTTTKMDQFVDTNGVTLPAPTVIVNNLKTSSSNFTIGGGIEKRKGEGRLQGYYGGELLISLGGNKSENTYGVALDSTNIADGTANGWANYAVNNRVLSTKAKTFGFGLRGFIGVEYFIFPKISIGGEFGWGLGLNSVKEGESVTEHEGTDESYANLPSATNPFGTRTTYEVTTVTPKSSAFVIDTDSFGGNIKLMFHF